MTVKLERTALILDMEEDMRFFLARNFTRPTGTMKYWFTNPQVRDLVIIARDGESVVGMAALHIVSDNGLIGVFVMRRKDKE